MRKLGFTITLGILAFCGVELPFLAVNAAKAEPVRVIFDTDMYTDIDDMLALAMLNNLEDRGETKLLAVTINSEAKWIAPYVEAVNTYYGHGHIPVGMVRGGITEQRYNKGDLYWGTGPGPFSPNGINYTQYIAQLRHKIGTLVYPHKLTDRDKAEDAVPLLRRVLAAQPDQSVVMIQVGFSTTFARLLESAPDKASGLSGLALVKQKVRLLSLMGGSFTEWPVGDTKIPAGDSRLEFNLKLDVPSAQKLFSDWPTPIVISGNEIGGLLAFKEFTVDHDFRYAKHHPIAETYRYVSPYYRGLATNPDAPPHDHPTWDLTSVLYAARPDHGYFTLSKAGRMTILPDGGSKFQEMEGGLHRYFIQNDEQRARTLEAMTMLVTQPPVHATSTGK